MSIISQILAVAATLLLVSGCAHRDHGSTSSSSQSTISSSGYSK